MPGLSWGMRGLVPWPGVKPGPPVLGVWSPSLWNAEKVPEKENLWDIQHRDLHQALNREQLRLLLLRQWVWIEECYDSSSNKKGFFILH